MPACGAVTYAGDFQPAALVLFLPLGDDSREEKSPNKGVQLCSATPPHLDLIYIRIIDQYFCVKAEKICICDTTEHFLAFLKEI